MHGQSSATTSGDGRADPFGASGFNEFVRSKDRWQFTTLRFAERMMTNPDSHQDSTSDRPLRGRDKGSLATRIGIALILLSGMLWFSLFAIPFLPLTLGQKAALAGADFVGVQIAWWTGAALVGPRTLTRLKSWLRGRKKTGEP